MKKLLLKCKSGQIVPVTDKTGRGLSRLKRLLNGVATPIDDREREFVRFLRGVVEKQ